MVKGWHRGARPAQSLRCLFDFHGNLYPLRWFSHHSVNPKGSDQHQVIVARSTIQRFGKHPFAFRNTVGLKRLCHVSRKTCPLHHHLILVVGRALVLPPLVFYRFKMHFNFHLGSPLTYLPGTIPEYFKNNSIRYNFNHSGYSIVVVCAHGVRTAAVRFRLSRQM